MQELSVEKKVRFPLFSREGRKSSPPPRSSLAVLQLPNRLAALSDALLSVSPALLRLIALPSLLQL